MQQPSPPTHGLCSDPCSSHACMPLGSLSQRRSDTVVLECGESSMTGRELRAAVASLSASLASGTMMGRRHLRPNTAAGIAHAPALARGDRVAMLALNSDAFVVALLGVLDAGGVAVPLNTRWTAQDVAHALQLASPTLLLVEEEHAALAEQAVRLMEPAQPAPVTLDLHACVRAHARVWSSHSRPQLQQRHSKDHHQQQQQLHQQQWHPQQVSRTSAAVQSGGTSVAPNPPALQLAAGPHGEALIVFTSGTTGRPKGVTLSHASLHAQSLAKLAAVGYAMSDVYLHLAPLFHVGGLSSFLANLMAGARQVVLARFDAKAALAAIARGRATSLIAVPTMIADLAAQAGARASAAHAGNGGAGDGSGASAQGAGGVAASAAAPHPTPASFASVQRVLVGAGGMTQSQHAALSRLFPRATVHTAYGMTEAASSITFLKLGRTGVDACAATGVTPGTSSHACADDAQAHAHCVPRPAHVSSTASFVGFPGPGVEVQIVASDEQQQQQLRTHSSGSGAAQLGCAASARLSSTPSSSAGRQGVDDVWTVGEVWTRGPHVMLGYWNDPAATAAATAPGGWLRTGDLGCVDGSGGLWLLGRAKDVIKTGGENVLAQEVEQALCAHPCVVSAAVVGLRDARLGERVAALLVLTPRAQWEGSTVPGSTTPALGPHLCGDDRGGGASLTLSSLQGWCRARGLAGFKLPRFVAATAPHGSGLPTNANGKVLKHVVRSLLARAEEPVVLSRL